MTAPPAGQDRPSRSSLSTHDDIELIGMVQSLPHDSSLREAACAELVCRYDFLVHHAAMRYRNSPEPQEELHQAGYVGLIKAINSFDATRGPDLKAYALPCISGELKRHFRDKRWQVHVRRSAKELRANMVKARAELTQQLARIPTDQEIGEHLGLGPDDLADAHRADAAFQAVSLDAPVSAVDPAAATLGDLMGSDDPGLDTALSMDAVWTHLGELPEREQHMLTMRFYGNLTQDQIGQELGISQMHVSRLLTHALTYLRDRILGQGDDQPTAHTEEFPSGESGPGRPPTPGDDDTRARYENGCRGVLYACSQPAVRSAR